MINNRKATLESRIARLEKLLMNEARIIEPDMKQDAIDSFIAIASKFGRITNVRQNLQATIGKPFFTCEFIPSSKYDIPDSVDSLSVEAKAEGSGRTEDILTFYFYSPLSDPGHSSSDTTLFTRWSQKLKDFVDVENNLSTFEMRLKSDIKQMLERPEESLLSSEERMRNTNRRERLDKIRRNTWTKQKAKAAWDRADHYDQVPWSKLSIPSPDTWDSLPDESDL